VRVGGDIMKIQILQVDGKWRTIDTALNRDEARGKKKYWKRIFGQKERIRIS
jgi:hypothetical protein